MVHDSHARFAVLAIIIFFVIIARNLKLFRGHVFSNAAKVMLFLSDAQYYVPVKLCRTAGSIHLFNITVKVTPEHITVKRNILWDVIEIGWKEVNRNLNGKKINLPTSVIIPFRDKLKIRHIIR